MENVLTCDEMMDVAGGDYVDTTLGLIASLSFCAGVIGSAGLLGAAVAVGAGLLAYEEL